MATDRQIAHCFARANRIARRAPPAPRRIGVPFCFCGGGSCREIPLCEVVPRGARDSTSYQRILRCRVFIRLDLKGISRYSSLSFCSVGRCVVAARAGFTSPFQNRIFILSLAPLIGRAHLKPLALAALTTGSHSLSATLDNSLLFCISLQTGGKMTDANSIFSYLQYCAIQFL